ncbi:hypothetical protein [Roseicella aerolata]|uniref:Membrane-anchored protein n=1 Tax=Roseicella aerolata TaxID=2883479 RepID=A0A9X1LCN7_9PROT|nr:hypothetical protein [Roseicella aerolata]MCB4823822.1 hypothetical protein [Roseicella aerolata]
MMMLKPDAPMPEAGRVTEAPAATGLPSDVRGVIDNATPDRLYGWAWDFGHPAHRVRVLLRLAGETLAETIADGARPDLAKAGIGDGCHAFELPVRAECRDRMQDVAVVALGADGREFQIAARLPRREEPPAGSALQRMVEGVIAEQRELKRELVALRERAGQPSHPDAGQAGEELQARVAHMELWLARLDARLAELAAPPQAPARGGIDPWQAVLYALLASLSAGALAAALLRALA